MYDINVLVFAGQYNTPDTYYNLLHYLAIKDAVGAFGDTLDDIVQQFQNSEQFSCYSNDQKMWHFGITFKRKDYTLIKNFIKK